jgi:hypothetical protein
MQRNRSRILDLVESADLLDEAENIRAADDRIALAVPVPPGRACRLGADEMAEILRAAKAPEPWARGCITVIGKPEPRLQGEDLKDRLQKVLGELRRLLPRVIQSKQQSFNRAITILSGIMDGPPGPADVIQRNIDLADELSRQANDLDKLRVLLAAVEETPSLVRRTTKDWHSAAIWLAYYYRKVVGDIRISADGPGVRFIGTALYRLGWGAKTPGAIAQAVRRA